MPTSDSDDDDIEKMYQKLEDLTRDWNAVVGEGRGGKEISKYGLGKRNECGD